MTTELQMTAGHRLAVEQARTYAEHCRNTGRKIPPETLALIESEADIEGVAIVTANGVPNVALMNAQSERRCSRGDSYMALHGCRQPIGKVS